MSHQAHGVAAQGDLDDEQLFIFFSDRVDEQHELGVQHELDELLVFLGA